MLDLSVGQKASIKIGESAIEYTVYPGRVVSVDTIKTPHQERDRGFARAAMNAVLAETDRAGFVVVLTPEPIHGEAKMLRLVEFYRSLGFSWMASSPVRRMHPDQDHFKMARLPVMAEAA